MKVTVIGTGFVGVVTAAVLANFKNRVYALDIDKEKVNKLSKGNIPFYEPKLESLVQKGIKNKTLTFTTSYKQAISQAEIIILSVGTPSAKDGTADLSYIFSACKSLAPYIKDKAIVAIKSTVPPSTNSKVQALVEKYTNKTFYVAALPEFLKEGAAVKDSLNPDRVVIGSSDKWVIDRLLKLHQPFTGSRVIISPESAQTAKYTANAYLAQRITFINQIANLCEKNGADVNQVIEAISADKRIGSHYWYPGLGYGGSCFPKDIKELAAYSRSIGEGDGLFVKLDELNEKRISKLLTKFTQIIGEWKGKTVAVLGLSFKPNTDDMREAPCLQVIPFLKKHHVRQIRAYDPQAIPAAKSIFPDLYYASDPYKATENADVTILLVEWPTLAKLDLDKLKELMKGKWFIDTRNQYNPSGVRDAGLRYIGIGRK